MQGRAPKGMRRLGYAVDGMVVPAEAAAVRAIYVLFTKVEHPESLRSLARALSGAEEIEGLSALPKHTHTVSVERADARVRQGLEPRRIVENGPWSPATVLGILRDPRYAAFSTYTPKVAQADGKHRRTWKAQILRDEAGEPIRGAWEPIVEDEIWWEAQRVLDDSERITNTSGSTKRKHLGSGLYRCGYVDENTGEKCGRKVIGAPRGYKCAGHVVRSGAAIDDFVTTVDSKRLAREDASVMLGVADGGPFAAGIDSAVSEQRARVLRAEAGYDAEITEARDLRRVRGAAEARIQELEAERLFLQERAGVLSPVLGVDGPAKALLAALLDLRRQIVDALAAVTLLPQPRGRKGFRPESVVIERR